MIVATSTMETHSLRPRVRGGCRVALLAAAGLLAGGAVWADDTSIPTLTEVIVTAQKRAENLQDVPIAVQAFSHQELQDNRVTDLKNLSILAPGVTGTSSTSENSTTIRIRGIGTVADNPGLESSVGVVIDGVYRPRNGVGFGNLGEIDQIEVLEGPQGELFGKNNDAGVISVLTKRPSMQFEANGELTVGNYNDKEVWSSVTGPVSNDSAVRLYASYQKRDGFLTIEPGLGPNTDNNANNRDAYTLRGQYLVNPSDAVSFLLITDFSKRNESCCAAVPTVVGPFSGIINALGSIPVLGGRPGTLGIPPSNPVNPFDYDTYANGVTSQQIRDMGVSGQLDWDLGMGKLTSITAWRDNTIQAGNDVEYTGAALASQPATQANETDFKQFSQELRFAGKDGPLSWLVGGFFSSEILTPHSTFYAGPQFEPYIGGVASAAVTGMPDFLLVSELTGKPPGATFIPGVDGQADYFLQTDKSYALFTDETYTITPNFDVTAGIRYTREQKTADSHYNDPDGGAGCTSLLTSPGVAALGPSNPAYQFLLGYGCATAFNPFFTNLNTHQSLDEGKATGTIKFSYHVTQDLMAYASWADGYKAGGFNLARVVNPGAANPLAPVTNTGYPDETVNSYELGFKSTLAQNRLRLNLALFDEQYRNLQLNTYNGIEFIVTSLPRVESKGAEVDIDWLTPLSGFSLSGGVVYAFTNIDEFGTAIATFDPERLNNRLVFAPLWSGSLSATYQIPLSASLMIRAIATEKYNSSYNTDSSLNPVSLQSGYGIVNARLGIGAPDLKWAVEVWADNVADKGYKQIEFAAPFQYNAYDAFLGDPRTFGVTFRIKL